jgi:hypothetical protein
MRDKITCMNIYKRQCSFNTGSGMNNSVHLSQHGSNDIRLTVCNNDESVLVYDVPNMHNIVSLKMSSAANYGIYVLI